jgi:Putative peptidoglycan binding domain
VVAVDIVLRQGVGKIDSETRIRNRDQARKDDWLGGENEFDWPGEPSRPYDGEAQAQAASAPANGGERGLVGPSGTRTAPERAAIEDKDAIVRRRRLVALSILAAIVVIGVVVALATSGGGGNDNTAAATTTVQQPQSSTNASGAVSPPPPAASSPPASPPPPPAQPQSPSSSSTSSTSQVTLADGAAMSSGDSGAAVLALQQALFRLGYDVGTRDGKFGQTTEAAVMAFQKDQGLTEDGIVGAATVEKLNAAVASASSG